MYGTQSGEDRRNRPFQGELRSRKALLAAALKYTESCLTYSERLTQHGCVPVKKNDMPIRVIVIVITQMNPIKSEAEQMECIVARIGASELFRQVSKQSK